MVAPLVLAGVALGFYLLTKKESKSSKSSNTKDIQKDIKKPESKNNMENMTEKELVKAIKNGSKNWKDWNKNESNEKYYQEIERRNRLIETPKLVKVDKVFRDDPNAISMMKQKIENKEKMVSYWKSIIKFPARTYGRALGDSKWYALTGASTEVREAKKKLAKLEIDKKAGVKLERKNTFTTGKKRFYYKESS